QQRLLTRLVELGGMVGTGITLLGRMTVLLVIASGQQRPQQTDRDQRGGDRHRAAEQRRPPGLTALPSMLEPGRDRLRGHAGADDRLLARGLDEASQARRQIARLVLVLV